MIRDIEESGLGINRVIRYLNFWSLGHKKPVQRPCILSYHYIPLLLVTCRVQQRLRKFSFLTLTTI